MPEIRSNALTRRGFLAGGLSLAATFSTQADTLDGKSIRFLVGTEGSGGYEAYARTFARHLAITLPNISLSVESMPTADGRLAAKQIAEAPAGSLVIGLFETALLYSEIETDDLAPISLAQFNWLGKMAVDERVVVASTQSGIASVDDLIAKSTPAIFPASTLASRSSSEAYLLNAILGTAIQPVPGYNSAQRSLAMLSGEGQIIVGSYPSQVNLIDQGAANVILRLNAARGGRGDGTVPLLRDRANGSYGPLIELIELSCNLGRWIAAPPSIEGPELRLLREAFDRTVASRAFQDDAKAQRLSLDVLDGASVQQQVRNLLARKAELRTVLHAALDCGRKRATGARAC
jgi:tripartite-type tricarboxylate transporter receptor subunit TctC